MKVKSILWLKWVEVKELTLFIGICCLACRKYFVKS